MEKQFLNNEEEVKLASQGLDQPEEPVDIQNLDELGLTELNPKEKLKLRA